VEDGHCQLNNWRAERGGGACDSAGRRQSLLGPPAPSSKQETHTIHLVGCIHMVFCACPPQSFWKRRSGLLQKWPRRRIRKVVEDPIGILLQPIEMLERRAEIRLPNRLLFRATVQSHHTSFRGYEQRPVVTSRDGVSVERAQVTPWLRVTRISQQRLQRKRVARLTRRGGLYVQLQCPTVLAAHIEQLFLGFPAICQSPDLERRHAHQPHPNMAIKINSASNAKPRWPPWRRWLRWPRWSAGVITNRTACRPESSPGHHYAGRRACPCRGRRAPPASRSRCSR